MTVLDDEARTWRVYVTKTFHRLRREVRECCAPYHHWPIIAQRTRIRFPIDPKRSDGPKATNDN